MDIYRGVVSAPIRGGVVGEFMIYDLGLGSRGVRTRKRSSVMRRGILPRCVGRVAVLEPDMKRQDAASTIHSAIINPMSSRPCNPAVCLLAYPVGGNPTQYLVERVFAQNDLDWRYLTFEVRPEDLGDAVRGCGRGWDSAAGMWSPHKQASFPLLDRITIRPR